MHRNLPLLGTGFLLGLVLALIVAACGGSAGGSATPLEPSAPGASTAATSAPPSSVAAATTPASASPTVAAPSDTVWLCRPGLPANPCAGDLDATAIAADGSTSLQTAAPAQNPTIDCFYVYPTVSRQKTANATLAIDPEERAVAVAQAAQFSQVCQVYAPMYPQLTQAAIADPGNISALNAVVAYQGVQSAFLDYMAHYNQGRGIVFIGHSQGAFLLTALLKVEVDSVPAARRLLVSALLLGGNVTVPAGKTVGGDFSTIAACESATQIGCVVAYSSFASTPPSNALFGRTDSALNPFGRDTSGSTQVLCVNPAAPAGGSGALASYLPTKEIETLLGTKAPKSLTSAKTPFVTLPGEFTARCRTAGGSTWLQVDRPRIPGDKRPGLSNVGSPRWGLHVVDVNVALGNLVDLVASEASAFGR